MAPQEKKAASQSDFEAAAKTAAETSNDGGFSTYEPVPGLPLTEQVRGAAKE